MPKLIKGTDTSTILDVPDSEYNRSSIPGGTTFGERLINSGYTTYNPSTPSVQPPKQPSLTVNSSDLVNRPLVQQPAIQAPTLPTYNTSTPVYTPPQQIPLPEMPKLQQINLGNAPVVQSQDEILQNIQNRIKPLSDQEQANIQQGVQAAFAPQLASQERVNQNRNLYAKAAAVQRGDLGYGTSELTYGGLASVQQEGVDALGRLRAAQIAEQNTRLQAANESNRQNQLDLLNQASQLRSQQQQEAQAYVNNQMAQNDAALNQYKMQIDNTRYANEQQRQAALDQFDALKYQNDLKRQQYQDQVQAYTTQREQAKDTLAMISELSPQDISSFGDLSSLESSIGLPQGYVSALQRTKLASQTAKTQAEVTDVYNKGVQLAMDLPVGQSFSLKNPDGTTTTFTGTKPNEFQVIDNAHGMWKVNKDTGEITKIQSFAQSSGSGGGGGGGLANLSNSSNLPGFLQIGQIDQEASIGSGMLAGLQAGIGANNNLGLSGGYGARLGNGQTTFDKLSAKERTKLAGQLNQASSLGLLPGQSNSGTLNDKQQAVLDKTPEVKKLITLSDFKSKLSRYNNLVDTYGIQLTGSNKAKLDQAYADLKISYKTAAELGALAGPDIEILMDAIKPATGLGGLKQKITGGGVTGIKNSITQMIGNVNEDAQKNINLLNSRNPIYKNSDYVNTLIEPFQSSNSSSGIDSVKNQYGISY